MGCNENPCRGCRCGTLVFSLMVAVLIGVVSFFIGIPGIVIAVLLAGALGAIFLLLLTVRLLFLSEGSGCLCAYGRCLLVGSVGTVVAAIAALTVLLSLGFVFFAVLAALVAFFFTLMLSSLVSLLLCTLCHRCR